MECGVGECELSHPCLLHINIQPRLDQKSQLVLMKGRVGLGGQKKRQTRAEFQAYVCRLHLNPDSVFSTADLSQGTFKENSRVNIF